jgi:hypothetical protein
MSLISNLRTIMQYTRQEQYLFLEEELRAQTDLFNQKLNTSASYLLFEREEIFVAKFVKFHEGELILKFNTNRGVPRKGEYLYCFTSPKQYHDFNKWGKLTYGDLLKNKGCATELVCIWQSTLRDDPNYCLVGFRGAEIEFAEHINGHTGAFLILGPNVPPYQYISNLQKLTRRNNVTINHLLEGDYSSQETEYFTIPQKDSISDFIQKQLFFSKSVVLQGPPGTGKTTVANIIAKNSGMQLFKLNATTASLSDVKEVISSADGIFSQNGILLYLDEIQYFNKKQQQSLLEYIEDGRVTLITSTTENPHFYVYNAIISRSSLFEFKPVAAEDCAVAVRRAVDYLNAELGTQKTLDADTARYIASCTGGDVRHAIVVTENAFFAADSVITNEIVDELGAKVTNFDDDTHYDLLSCLQKSIRGSDPDATAFYLAKLLSLGELISVCRRLQVIASEDVGAAYPMAAVITRACCESAKEL